MWPGDSIAPCQTNRTLAILLFLTIFSHRLHFQSVSSSNIEDANLSKAFAYHTLLGVVVQSILNLAHEAGSPDNFNIQFPIYIELLRHLEGVPLNMSMHQYCVISIASPTGHRKHASHQSQSTKFGMHILYIITRCTKYLFGLIP